MKIPGGSSLFDLSHEKKVLLVFLRDMACAFCRQTLADVSAIKEELVSRGVSYGFVHLNADQVAQAVITKFDLRPDFLISDVELQFYQAFGLGRAKVSELVGLRSFLNGVDSGIIKGNGFSFAFQDMYQKPGVFVVHNGEIINSYVHRHISERPNYLQLLGIETT